MSLKTIKNLSKYCRVNSKITSLLFSILQSKIILQALGADGLVSMALKAVWKYLEHIIW